MFGAVFERGRKASIAAAERIGGRILEVGVGTGISLPDYRAHNRLVGVDISEPMLRKAQERVAEHKLDQCRGARGDGRAAPRLCRRHPSTSWWRNTSSPRCRIPEATLDEFARVLKPGGEIMLVNHIGAESGPRRLFEQASRRWRGGSAGGRNSAGAGWRDWAARHGGVRLIERRPMPPLGHFSLIRFASTRLRRRSRASGRGDGEMSAQAGDDGLAAGAAAWKSFPLESPLNSLKSPADAFQLRSGGVAQLVRAAES